jgi:hypothetical protein
MAKDDKTRVDIVNRPSERYQHTADEWSKHIELREMDDTRRDIVMAREKLGRFTVRFVTEAIYGDEYARQIYGDDGGQELIRDMKIDRKALGSLAQNVGGARAKTVAERHHLVEDDPQPQLKTHIAQADHGAGPAPDASAEAQVELLRALLKMMDPSVVKKALGG